MRDAEEWRPGLDEMSEIMGVSRESLMSAIRDLLARGEIEVTETARDGTPLRLRAVRKGW